MSWLRGKLNPSRGTTANQAFANAVVVGGVVYAAIAVSLSVFVAHGQGRLFGVAGFMAFASAAIGAVAGFVFAVPKIPSAGADQDDVAIASAKGRVGRLVVNTNLGQVSDWLTKLVVGLSLVQFHAILRGLQRLGALSADTFTYLARPAAALFGVCLVLSSVTISFLMMYMWTASRMPEVLAPADPPAADH